MSGIAKPNAPAPSWPPPALDPAGPFAAPLAEIIWVMLAMGCAVFAIVLAVLFFALRRNGRWRAFIASPRAVLIGGFAFPVIVLSASLVYGLWTTARVTEAPAPGEMRVRVIGEMWWWRVIYLQDGQSLFETANEIRIPAGTPVTFELQSGDVIHSFWVPRLGAKLDMIPGRTNILRLEADRPGIYRGQCTEFCGAAHALMAFELIALDAADFATWREAQMRPAALGANGDHARALFQTAGCAACHSVRGTDANGAIGPDLTHFASRRTLGAGILTNDPPTLRQWLADAASLKPGARMPSYAQLPPADLEALALYMEQLQ